MMRKASTGADKDQTDSRLRAPEMTEEDKTQERTRARKTNGTALEKVFCWLGAGGRQVMNLTVVEDPAAVTSEATVQHCLNQVRDIRYLDWNRPDLSIQTLEKAPLVVELTHAWSGANAVLAGWHDQNGLQKLTKVGLSHLPRPLQRSMQFAYVAPWGGIILVAKAHSENERGSLLLLKF